MESEHLKFQSFIRKDTRLKVIILSCFFFFQIFSSLAQGRDNFWILGYKYSNGTNGNSILNFDTLPVVPHKVDMGLNFLESNACISDTRGNLLFYTNGVKILNRYGQTMVNGDSLNPGPYASSFQNHGLRIGQGQIIIPFPGDTNKYYLFHETIDFNGNTTQPFHLFYSIIDMSLDSGKGAVSQKNIPAISDTLIAGEITSCKHANGRDWWVVVHRYKSTVFLSLLITPNGVFAQPPQNIGGIFKRGSGGQACISPDGKKYARYHQTDGLSVFDFDRCSGLFSNHKQINNIDSVFGLGGVSFSPNSNELYLNTDTKLYQFNLADTSQPLSNLKFLVAEWDSFFSPSPPFATSFYLQQLAPDGKIYMSCGNGVPNLHVINYPDSIGLACGFVQHAIILPTVNGFTIPNFPTYDLGADSGSVCDTLMLSVKRNPSKSEIVTISVFPNPADNYFYISCENPSKQPVQFCLFNAFGQEEIRENLSGVFERHFIDTKKLPTGIYFWKFREQSGKLIITK